MDRRSINLTKSKSDYLQNDIWWCRDTKKLVKALREYDNLIEKLPNSQKKATKSSEKLYKRKTRLEGISNLYVIVLFKDVVSSQKYFAEMESLLIQKNKTFSFLPLKKKIDEICQIDESGADAILLAVLNNWYSIVEMLLIHGAGHNRKYVNDLTLLHLAAAVENIQTWKLILDFDIYFHTVYNLGENKSSQEDETQKANDSFTKSKFCQLNKLKNNIMKKENKKNESSEQMMKVEQRIIDSVDADGRTVLHYACMKNNRQMAKMLLDYGWNSNIKDNNGAGPIDYLTPKSEILNILSIHEDRDPSEHSWVGFVRKSNNFRSMPLEIENMDPETVCNPDMR